MRTMQCKAEASRGLGGFGAPVVSQQHILRCPLTGGRIYYLSAAQPVPLPPAACIRKRDGEMLGYITIALP